MMRVEYSQGLKVMGLGSGFEDYKTGSGFGGDVTGSGFEDEGQGLEMM